MGPVRDLKGQLLVAGPSLFDRNFRRAVVLVGEHNDEGSLGVVLNRPTDLLVREVAAPLAPLARPDDRLFMGGPVQPEAAVVLAEFDAAGLAGLPVFGSIGFMIGDVPDGTGETVRRARVFAGYAGWGAGQLESEIEEGSWILEQALEEDVFAARPEELWSAVLRRKGGRYVLLSTMPLDPSSN